MMGRCYLCQKEKQLQKKCHVFPKFVVKKVKELSTGKPPFLFHIEQDKLKTTQDAYARYHYCRDCDNGIMNRYGERPVSSSYKFPEKMADADEPAMVQFTHTVIFRAAINRWNLADQGLNSAIDCWRKSILNRRPVQPCHPVLCYSTHWSDDQVSQVLNSTLNYDIVSHLGARLVWVNMPGFFMLGVIDNGDTPSFKSILANQNSELAMFASLGEQQAQKLLTSLPKQAPANIQKMLDRGVI